MGSGTVLRTDNTTMLSKYFGHQARHLVSLQSRVSVCVRVLRSIHCQPASSNSASTSDWTRPRQPARPNIEPKLDEWVHVHVQSMSALVSPGGRAACVDAGGGGAVEGGPRRVGVGTWRDMEGQVGQEGLVKWARAWIVGHTRP